MSTSRDKKDLSHLTRVETVALRAAVVPDPGALLTARWTRGAGGRGAAHVTERTLVLICLVPVQTLLGALFLACGTQSFPSLF